MQSSKTSKKTIQSTPESGAPTTTEPTSKPRAKSSKSKSESNETTNAKLHRKASGAPSQEPISEESATVAAAAPVETAQAVGVDHDKIAQLAHFFWAERGFAHGDHEQDWLRAEQELRSATASA